MHGVLMRQVHFLKFPKFFLAIYNSIPECTFLTREESFRVDYRFDVSFSRHNSLVTVTEGMFVKNNVPELQIFRLTLGFELSNRVAVLVRMH